ncbi:MAG: hypothetical protein BWY80_00052 [Firmicutes bacterium ADurb.Bin456]|nr:MAG: hypothetical protein BWY80_00052 [Firmicutes bacterium ADurb.Bin456]
MPRITEILFQGELIVESCAYVRMDPVELRERATLAYSMLGECTVFPRNCRVNRLGNERGICKGGRCVPVSSYGQHFGEEAPLVGKKVQVRFFHCYLSCEFCQNSDISQEGRGREISAGELA